MRAFITGANGMLGTALLKTLKNYKYEILATDLIANKDIVNLDVRSHADILSLSRGFNPDIIFHLAAETDVDKCELNEGHAYETNAKGTEIVAAVSKELDIPMVYISTGAVFDGEKSGGYTELDKPNPLSIYGKSKLKGEEAVISLLKKYYIVRAGWMIGGDRKDKKFVGKIIELLKTKKEIPVVIDKSGSPTFTNDFSKGIFDIVSNCEYGLYHCVNKGICTRFDIAKKIVEYLKKEDVVIKPVNSDAFPLPAPRGKSEAMINYKLSSMGRDNMRTWQEALREYLSQIEN